MNKPPAPLKSLEQLFADASERLYDVLGDIYPDPADLEDYDSDLERIQKMADAASQVATILRQLAHERTKDRIFFIEKLQQLEENKIPAEELYQTRGNSFPRKS